MNRFKSIGLAAVVFWLVAAAFTTIYITQPVLPVLQSEFGVSETQASLTISMVVLGIALANLPFGRLADRYRVKPLIAVGGFVVTASSFYCALSENLPALIAARFIQGLFLPCLTTCVAAYLSRTLPLHRLNVIMGSYISATVAGGLGGRLLGGWIHPPLHWRYAFFSASVFLLAATLAALFWLPGEKKQTGESAGEIGFVGLLRRTELLMIYAAAFSAFFVFSSIFNFLPFYLSGPPFNASTGVITMMYLSYLIGVVMGPLAGNISNRIGNGATMAMGAVIFAVSIGLTLIPSMIGVVLSLAGICAGFFAIHASAAGALNRKLTASRGRANSLYVLFYYLGGYSGITLSGLVYVRAAWQGVTVLGVLMLVIPLSVGILDIRRQRHKTV
ncbi:MAG: MFS transporter [Desulfobacterales bacterium]|nr:MFS transporter [Desulfobacterales bacterium]